MEILMNKIYNIHKGPFRIRNGIGRGETDGDKEVSTPSDRYDSPGRVGSKRRSLVTRTQMVW